MGDKSQSSLDTLYEDHFSVLIGKLFKVVGCHRVAEDLAQEAYIRVSATLAQRQVEYLRSYLYQTAHNLALDHLRKEKVRSGRPLEQNEAVITPDELATTSPSPEQTVISMQRVDRLQLALESLPERRREILLLHKIHHMKYKDIAEKLGISVSAVEKNMQLALAHCMKIKSDENF